MAAFDRLRRRAPRVQAVLRQLGDLVSMWIDRPTPTWRADAPIVRTPVVPRATIVVPGWCEHARAHAAKWIDRVRDGSELDAAEHTRKLRVAIRRVRALLRVIGEPDSPPADRNLRKRGRRLGALRDLDLALEHAVAARALSGSTLQHTALEELEAWLARRRTSALAAARGGSEDVGVELDAFALAIATLADDEPRAHALASSALQSLASELAATLDASVGEAELERLHAMRIAARRLRYVAELFEPLLDEHHRELLARARDLQRAIGSHRDAAIWHVTIGERIAKAEGRGHLTFARGLAEALPAASSASAREHVAIAGAIERLQAALAR
ncbi:MAG TPA: CHAD domain-containing protein [Nannocystaceae bacterium]|nr:CHAD domain-containing protein [Nannocystaceae bacterium]